MNQRDISIILVQPKIPENIGFIARSMKAFGYDNLTLVSPEFELTKDSPAYKTARGAAEILDTIKIVSSFEFAIQEQHKVIGFSRRLHDFKRPQLDLVNWASEWRSEQDDMETALVFGPEDFGLSNNDKQRCDVLVNIPLYSSTLSLNLAHAVTVVLYELSRDGDTFQTWMSSSNKIDTHKSFATHADIQRLVDRVAALMENTYFFKSGRERRQIEIIRCLVQRFRLSENEYEFAMGMVNTLLREVQDNR